MRQWPVRIVAGCVALVLGVAWLTSSPSAQSSRAVEASLAHFNANRVAYGLDSPSSDLRARRTRVDPDGVTHIRYDQTYKGLPVFEGEAITHVDTSGGVEVTSALRNILGVDVSSKASRTAAVASAVTDINPKGEYQVRDASLWILPRSEHNVIDRLVWHVAIVVENDVEDPAEWRYFVDARTGSIVWSFNALETSASLGTGRTMYDGNRTVNTDSTSGTFFLRDLTRGGGNYTCDMNNRTGSACGIFTRTSNIFGDNLKTNTDRATAGADAHFGLLATWDYYKNMFGRNGIDGAGRRTFSRVHYSSRYENAFWSDSCFCMTYGDGATTFYPLVSLDVAGHEMSHGVMSREANLTYAGESGGLNESSSDIFGTMVEFAVNSATDVPDYWIGEVIFRSNYSSGTFVQTRALRYMDDPAKDGRSPACWSSGIGSLDVHYSSGPNNHMYYLLSHGGTSKCNGAVVTGIGNDKAARIWYKAIADFMTASTNYHGARTAALNAATSLYGTGSAEYNAVNSAFAGINVQ